MKQKIIIALVIGVVAVVTGIFAVKNYRKQPVSETHSAQLGTDTNTGQQIAKDASRAANASPTQQSIPLAGAQKTQAPSNKNVSAGQNQIQTQTPLASKNQTSASPQSQAIPPSQPAEPSNPPPASQTPPVASPPPAQTPPLTTSPPAETPPPTGPQSYSFSTEADEASATPNTFTVKAGDTVNLTINVKTTGVYFGGIDFRGNSIDTGTIKAGEFKTITFTADNSVTLRGYWPSNGQQKNVFIAIVAQ